jgi:hypothetical protein
MHSDIPQQPSSYLFDHRHERRGRQPKGRACSSIFILISNARQYAPKCPPHITSFLRNPTPPTINDTSAHDFDATSVDSAGPRNNSNSANFAWHECLTHGSCSVTLQDLWEDVDFTLSVNFDNSTYLLPIKSLRSTQKRSTHFQNTTF